jgi:hypothetical protein
MLLWKAPAKKYDAAIEQVDAARDGFMLLDNLPCFFHAAAPVNVIKNKNRKFMVLCKALIEVIQR